MMTSTPPRRPTADELAVDMATIMALTGKSFEDALIDLPDAHQEIALADPRRFGSITAQACNMLAGYTAGRG